jgi:5-methylcytosine-specific restriction endonuclease McrA
VTYISDALRRLVAERADYRCEYCLLPEEYSTFPHEPDHVIPLKHGGVTTADNLALACFWCNRLKGSDLTTLDPQTDRVTSLFDPRQQAWADHFQLDDATIVPLTPEGRATTALLKFNRADRLTARQLLFNLGYYP